MFQKKHKISKTL